MSKEANRLEEANAAYNHGDFKTARSLAKAIAEDGTAADDQRNRAREILAATGLDPLAVLVFSGTALLLVYLILRYIF